MKSEKLQKAIGKLDDDLIEAADQAPGKANGRRIWTRLGLAAACLVLAFAAVGLPKLLSRPGTTPGAQPTGTQPAISSTASLHEGQPDESTRAVLLSAVVNAKPLGFSAFDNQLVEYLKQTGKADENFTVSPLSFKAALTMTVLGAEGETQSQLLDALGFQNADELRAWYATVLAGVDGFAEFFERMEQYNENPLFFSGHKEITSAYQVVNSVWSNQDLPGAFRQSFLDDIARTCYAEACSARAAELANAVNAWVREKTRGLIPSILNDASKVSAVLVNALYLKTGWENNFWKLGEQDFTTVSGETVQKPFMQQTNRMRYYQDEQTQLVSVPLEGGVSMVFVLGEDAGLADKLYKAESRMVEVTVPMFDVETSLNQKELVNYLKLMGCDRLFDPETAELDPMYTDSLYVEDIVQKAKVHIDEEGLEAAAVTAMTAVTGGIMPEPEEPAIFCADRPFSFYVLMEGETPELLFWGQIIR